MPEVEVGDVNISERFSQLTDNGSASKCLLVGCQAIFHTKFRRAVHHPHERIASIGLPSHETTPFAKRARCPINDLVGHVHPDHIGQARNLVDPFTVAAADHQNTGDVVSLQLRLQQLDTTRKSNEVSGRLPPFSRGIRRAAVSHW